ncbi:hypothetical protein RRSWK_01136 [Rhodopirellula sp. SWK7]|nr:hypothetical protein RRSWK_01136 [Rhodopirellula sp. SWK7]
MTSFVSKTVQIIQRYSERIFQMTNPSVTVTFRFAHCFQTHSSFASVRLVRHPLTCRHVRKLRAISC